MKKGKYFVIWVLLLLVACVPTSVVTPTLRTTPKVAATVTVTLTPEPTLTETFTPTPTPVSTLNFYFPRIEKYCPSQKEVSVRKLGFDSDTQLILTDSNRTSIWGLSSGNQSPVLISKIVSSGWMSSYSISPDGNWLAYAMVDANSASISIFSFNALNTIKNINLNYWDGLVPKVSWLSNDEVLIENNCYTRGCYFPLYVFNLATGELRNVDKKIEPYGDYLEFFKDSSNFYALYYGGSSNSYVNFDVFDYSKNQKLSVFQWLNKKILFFPNFPTNLSVKSSPSDIAMLVQQSYGFDLGIVEKSIESLINSEDYDAIMKRVVVETEFQNLSYYPVGLNSFSHALFLDMNYSEYLEGQNRTKDIENGFFSLDYQNIIHSDHINYLVFKDYCFAEADSYFRSYSADGKFAIFANPERNKLIILNLETGHISRLSGWDYVGWR